MLCLSYLWVQMVSPALEARVMQRLTGDASPESDRRIARILWSPPPGLCSVGGGGGQGGFLVRSLVGGPGSYSVAHRTGLLPTELTGMWGWILLRSPHRGRGSPPAPAPTKQRPVSANSP